MRLYDNHIVRRRYKSIATGIINMWVRMIIMQKSVLQLL